ncbi:nitroreductase family protein [Blastococcus jejuensis]|uniref:Nitroreductase family protein n=1 Tax=Blastococcus jejuensis TaxID=351224 RepID=A0ABP6NZA2_9ACTN
MPDTVSHDLARALEQAADRAARAPSVHNTQPWRIELQPDHLVLRDDPSRQLKVLDPQGRELVQSVGAALFNIRVSLAASGWAVEVDRLPDPGDPDLLAVVRPVAGPPDAVLAALAPAIDRRRTNRRAFLSAPVPDAVIQGLASSSEAEGALLVPVLTAAHRQLIARATQQADRIQNADPAYRAELRTWTNRPPEAGDGVPPVAVPHVDGLQQDDVPIRDFDTAGAGALSPETHSSADQTMVLLSTRTDDRLAWLRAGEALERVLLELTASDWVAGPLTQPIEVPLTRTQLRAALTWDAHPQMLLRIGKAAPTARTPRRPRSDVVVNSRRPEQVPAVPPQEPTARRPVPDGRGGTTWV